MKGGNGAIIAWFPPFIHSSVWAPAAPAVVVMAVEPPIAASERWASALPRALAWESPALATVASGGPSAL